MYECEHGRYRAQYSSYCVRLCPSICTVDRTVEDQDVSSKEAACRLPLLCWCYLMYW